MNTTHHLRSKNYNSGMQSGNPRTYVLLIFTFLFSAFLHSPAQLPDVSSGGKNGGPIDLLIYRGHCEMNFGHQPILDQEYLTKLEERGYRVTILGPTGLEEKDQAPVVGEWRPLSLDYLKQFNTVIYLSPSPYLGGGYFDHTNWRSGEYMITIRKNLDVLQNYVEAGGGLLIVPSLEELCMRTTESLQDLFSRYGAWTECAVVRDETRRFVPDKILNVFPVLYSWTEAIADHPVATSVNRIWYPAYATRWDDNYTTIPLFSRDSTWTSIVNAEPEGGSYWLRGTVYDPAAKWYPAENMPNNPSLFMVRDFGKGRVAICGIGAYHLYYLTYSKTGKFAEANFAVVDGIAMEYGNTRREPYSPKKTKRNPDPQPVQTFTDKELVPSDMHILLDNTYRWLSQPSIKASWGGYNSESGISAGEAKKISPEKVIASRWGSKDPMMNPEKVRPMRILVGARSAMSSGKGSPEEWASAARKAGYDVVCFTETLEDVDIPRWTEFVDACKKASDDQVYLLPGLDILSDLGDRFLVVGHTLPIRTHILTDDHKKMYWTGHMLLGMGDTLPIVSRPAHHAKVRGDQGALSPELYVACPGVAIKTYKDGKEVDDGIFAWKWQAFNSSQPIPVTVHEVDSPDDLTTAVATGMQNYINADQPDMAAWYFRQGHATFGGEPMRYYVSSGPMVDDLHKKHVADMVWTARLKAHSEAQLKEVRVFDQFGTYRQFKPDANEVDLTFSGDYAAERWLITHLTDVAGGEAYVSQMRVNRGRYTVIRCTDRQNWFSPLNWSDISYTCKTVTKGGTIELPGVQLAEMHCPKLQFVMNSNGAFVHENLYESTWVPDGNRFRGDNTPMWHDLPIPEYQAKLRFVSLGRRYKQYIADITTREELNPEGHVWPIVKKITPKKQRRNQPSEPISYVYADPVSDQVVRGTLASGGFIDLPAGGVAADTLALTPLRVDFAGNVGVAAPKGKVKPGTRFQCSWLQIDPKLADKARSTFGFDGEVPFTLELQQGAMKKIAWEIHVEAINGGMVGELTKATDPYLPNVPLILHGCNSRRPVGFWDAESGKITSFSNFEGVGRGILDISKSQRFYFGDLLLADHADLYLSFTSEWNENSGSVQVTNPTNKDITTAIRTPKAIIGRKALNKTVTVPAGQSVQIDF